MPITPLTHSSATTFSGRAYIRLAPGAKDQTKDEIRNTEEGKTAGIYGRLLATTFYEKKGFWGTLFGLNRFIKKAKKELVKITEPSIMQLDISNERFRTEKIKHPEYSKYVYFDPRDPKNISEQDDLNNGDKLIQQLKTNGLFLEG